MKFFTNIGEWVKDHLTDILMGAGTVGVVGGTVMACKATTNMPKIMDEYHEKKAEFVMAVNEDGEPLSDEELKRKIRKLKLETAGKVTLNYLPSALVEGLSLGSMWGGYSKMKGMYAGASTALMAVTSAHEHYRANVREEYGNEVDQKIAADIHKETITVNENGIEVEKEIDVYPDDLSKTASIYARYFTPEFSTAASNSLTYNYDYLRLQQDALNSRWRCKNHRVMCLNDVYQFLGFKKLSVAGNHVMWIYDPNKPSGDNYIDLRIRLVYKAKYDDFGNPDGYEQVYMIDPNVDGDVAEKAVQMGLMDR